MKLLIIGAGIAGLSTAALLQEHHDVTVIEKQPSQTHKGYAVGLWRSTDELFRHLKIYEEVLRKAITNPPFTFYDTNGQQILQAPFRDEPLTTILGHYELRTLLEEVLDEPVQYSTTTSNLKQTPREVRATINGAVESYDCVVAADGIHSATRKKYFTSKKQPTGLICHWDTIPPVEEFRNAAAEVLTTNAMAGLYTNLHGESVAILTTPTGEDPKQYLAPLQGIGARIRDAVSNPHSAPATWVVCKQAVRGRVVLIGDAAHAMPPFAGLGATMALEDAWVLYQELTNNVPESLAAYSARRDPRLQQAKALVAQQLRWKITRNKMLTTLRDAVAKYVPLNYFLKGYYRLVHKKP